MAGSSRATAFGWIVGAYLAALAAAWLVVLWAQNQGMDAFWAAAWADVAATVVIFAFSVAFRNSSYYDAYWSFAPPIIFGFWIIVGSGFDWRIALCLVVVVAWAVRLTRNWARGWTGLDHEDWRYEDLQQSMGPWYWPVSFLGIHMMPTVLVFVACIPLWIVSRSYVPFGALDVVAFVVGIAAVYLEWLADEQLHQFRLRREPDTANAVLRTGVWRWLRHPNYLGEISFWLSLALFGAAAGGGWLNWLGFLLMVGLFVFITIPMIDKRMLANKPAYAGYKAKTWALVPKWSRES